MRFGLDDKKIEKLITVISQSKAVKKAVIFGSRARGDYQYNSDIDIAVYADGETTPGLVSNISEAAGIYKTNVIMMNKLGNEDLRRNIENDGVEIYKKDER
jgi:predicted nucleotidyltransferase